LIIELDCQCIEIYYELIYLKLKIENKNLIIINQDKNVSQEESLKYLQLIFYLKKLLKKLDYNLLLHCIKQ